MSTLPCQLPGIPTDSEELAGQLQLPLRASAGRCFTNRDHVPPRHGLLSEGLQELFPNAELDACLAVRDDGEETGSGPAAFGWMSAFRQPGRGSCGESEVRGWRVCGRNRIGRATDMDRADGIPAGRSWNRTPCRLPKGEYRLPLPAGSVDGQSGWRFAQSSRCFRSQAGERPGSVRQFAAGPRFGRRP